MQKSESRPERGAGWRHGVHGNLACGHDGPWDHGWPWPWRPLRRPLWITLSPVARDSSPLSLHVHASDALRFHSSAGLWGRFCCATGICGWLLAMAALSSSAVAPCCVKGAVSFEVNRGVERSRSLRSGVWQMGACPLEQLRCVVAKSGASGAVSTRRGVVACAAAAAAAAATSTDVPTVSDTKGAFIQSYRKPIPSIYSNVIQELLVQQHLMRYNATYTYDPIFALGFVTVYDQLMDGYPNDADRDAIFKAYVTALNEDPELYRKDAKKLEEWATAQSGSGITDFTTKDGEVEAALKGIAERAAGKEAFHYSRFFAVGLFRLLECANASDPAVLENLSKALNVSKRSVDRDLDVYRNLLSKLAQGKELIKEYNEREKKKQAERDAASANSKSAETVAKTEGAKSE